MLRIGILGAAAIAPGAVVAPARTHPEVSVVAVAARDEARAQAFAARHGIGRVLPTYAALVQDPDLDAVYVALPNGLHGRWTAAALQCGKHVLCEKPLTADAAEAESVARLAAGTGLVLMEAFHYRYHALTARVLHLVSSGRLGRVRRIDAWFRARLRDPGDIRWDPALAGGALMDIGCYPAHLVRTLGRTEPTVVRARADVRSAGVDRWLQADMRFPDGSVASLSASMLARRPRASGARVVGSRATLVVEGFVSPQTGNRVEIRGPGVHRAWRVPPLPTSYQAQLAAFADAVLRGTPVPTGPADSVATMRLLDACYDAAGLERRRPTVA